MSLLFPTVWRLWYFAPEVICLLLLALIRLHELCGPYFSLINFTIILVLQMCHIDSNYKPDYVFVRNRKIGERGMRTHTMVNTVEYIMYFCDLCKI